MAVFIIKTRGKKQEKKVRDALNLVEVAFEMKHNDVFNSNELDKKIAKGRKELQEGKTITLDSANLWENLKLK